jgi:hypothetical protein
MMCNMWNKVPKACLKFSSLSFFLLLAAGLLCLAAPALAARPSLIDVGKLDQPLAPGSTLTWFQLLKHIFPGLEKPPEGAIEAVAATTVPVRHLDRDYEDQPLSGPLKFQVVSGLPYKAQNRRLFLLHLDLLGQTPGDQGPTVEEYSLLALFQLDPAPRLLDLVDIRADRFNGFWSEAPLLHLTPATQAVMIYHSHHNSNQGYLIRRLLFVRDRRLEEILQISTLSQQARCLTFTSTAAFRLLSDPARLYPRVAATVTLTIKPDPPDCRPRRPGSTRRFRETWRWQPAKQQYQEVAGNLHRLYKLYDQWY